MVTRSAAGAKGPGFNSPVGRGHLRFNYRASILAGRRAMLAMRCTVATNCDRICSAVDACGLVLRLQTWRSITNGRSKAQLKTREGA